MNDKLAFEWFKKGAQGGDSSAMNTLAICYETGRGVGVPEKKLAFKWYLKAAQAGNVAAMNNVGYCYLYGEGVDNITCNWNLAVDWFNESAKAGVADAMLNLGSCYQDGKGVAVDAKVAAVWYRKGARLHLKRATEEGDAHAMYKIGDCLDRGARGVPKDRAAALTWFVKAAAKGYTDAVSRSNRLKAELKAALS